MGVGSEKDAKQRRLDVGRRFASLYEDIGPEELAEGQDWSLDRAESALFLGTYSERGLRRVFDNYGFTAQLAGRGIDDFEVEVDTSDPFLHVLRLREIAGEVFCELRARTALGRDLGLPGRLAPLQVYVVEWLSIENPHGTFGPGRPQLPGQRRPGLGLGPEVEEILVLAARRIGTAALVSWPQWFHNAMLYHPRWVFVDAREEGRFAALIRDLGMYELPRLAWAVHLGCVIEDGVGPLAWNPGPMVLPRTREAARHFESPVFRAVRLAAKARTTFFLDGAALDQALAQRGVAL